MLQQENYSVIYVYVMTEVFTGSSCHQLTIIAYNAHLSGKQKSYTVQMESSMGDRHVAVIHKAAKSGFSKSKNIIQIQFYSNGPKVAPPFQLLNQKVTVICPT